MKPNPSPDLLLQIKSQANNDRGPRYTELFLQSIHQANIQNLPIGLVYRVEKGQVAQLIECPRKLERLVKSQFRAQYPDSTLARVEKQYGSEKEVVVAVRLYPDIFPVRTHPDFQKGEKPAEYSDPASALIASLAANVEQKAEIRLLVRRTSKLERLRAQRVCRHLSTCFFERHSVIAELYASMANSSRWPLRLLAFILRSMLPHKLATVTNRSRSVTEKLDRHTFKVLLHVTVPLNGMPSQARKRVSEIVGTLGQFTWSGRSVFKAKRSKRSKMLKWKNSFLLSDQELATIFHPSTEKVRVHKTSIATSKQLEPPVFLPRAADKDAVSMAKTDFPGRHETFGLLGNDRLRHCYIVGATGQGKSTLLTRMIVDDMRKARGLAVIDPHGELADDALKLVPAKRRRDVVRFEPANPLLDLRFNPLSLPTDASEVQREQMTNLLLGALTKIFHFDMGSAPRMQYVLRNAVRSLIDTPDATLLDLMEMLRNDHRRKEIIRQTRNPEVRKFWEVEFEGRSRGMRNEIVSPIQNKIGTITTSPLLSRVFGAKQSNFDLQKVMNKRKLLIVNLNKGELTDEVSSLFGVLLLAYFQGQAMSRSKQDALKSPFAVYCDEFQNMVSDSFESLLSEARKKGISLVLAHQYIGQLDDYQTGFSLRNAVFGNVGSVLSFRVGNDDAKYLAEYFGGDIQPEDIARLSQFHAFAKLMITGSPQGPFSLKLLPPIGKRSCRGTRFASKRRGQN